MLKRSWLIFLLVLGLLAGGVSSQDNESDPDPLLEMLAFVPDTSAVREAGVVAYADMRVAEIARGLPSIASAGDWSALSSDDQLAWLMAAPSFAMIPDLAMNFMIVAEDMPNLLGIDPFAINRTLYFGQPPQVGHILQGDFDPDAIGTALGARDYTVEAQGEVTVWCPQDGCDSGLQINVRAREPGNPFGGNFGRQEPFATRSGYFFNSADFSTLNAIAESTQDEQSSLGANPAYQAGVAAVGQDGLVRQAMFVEIPSIFAGDVAALVLGASATAEDIESLREQYGLNEDHIPVGQVAELAVIADLVQLDAETQTGRIALVYRNEAIAQAAAAELDRRLAQNVKLLTLGDMSLQETIEGRGGSLQSPQLFQDGKTGKWVLTLDAVAPLIRGSARDDDGRMPRSGLLAQLWVDMIYRRDLLWLA